MPTQILRQLRVARASACAVALVVAAPALGQEAINTGAATQPSKGRLVLRSQLTFTQYGDDPTGLERDISEVALNTMLTYGLTGDLAVQIQAPLRFRDIESPAGDEDVEGLDDFHILGKWRFYQEDTGPTDTTRASLLFGAQFSAPFGEYEDDVVNPMLGAVFTHIRGRHGLSGDLTYMLTTGGESDPISAGNSTADLVRANLAYLFRVTPAQYGPDTPGALYAVLESNNLFETNGDAQSFLSPGIMYEGRSWTVEASVMLPVAQDLSHRPETDYTLLIGLRLLF